MRSVCDVIYRFHSAGRRSGRNIPAHVLTCYNCDSESTEVISDPGDITRLLRQWKAGDREIESQLFELLLPDLRKIAGHHFRNERAGHTLQPTALVNEAFIRLVKAKDMDWQER